MRSGCAGLRAVTVNHVAMLVGWIAEWANGLGVQRILRQIHAGGAEDRIHCLDIDNRLLLTSSATRCLPPDAPAPFVPCRRLAPRPPFSNFPDHAVIRFYRLRDIDPAFRFRVKMPDRSRAGHQRRSVDSSQIPDRRGVTQFLAYTLRGGGGCCFPGLAGKDLPDISRCNTELPADLRATQFRMLGMQLPDSRRRQ